MRNHTNIGEVFVKIAQNLFYFHCPFSQCLIIFEESAVTHFDEQFFDFVFVVSDSLFLAQHFEIIDHFLSDCVTEADFGNSVEIECFELLSFLL